VSQAILVTGGLGFVGSHVARLVHETGRRVIILDNQSGGARPALPASIRMVQGDVGDRKFVSDVLGTDSIGAVIHFAGKIQVGESVKKPDEYFATNVVKTLTLLEVMRDVGIRKLIFSSSAAIYGSPELVPIAESAALQPNNPYGSTKLAVEMALEAWQTAFQFAFVAFRYFNAAGAHPDGSLFEGHHPETHLIPLAIDAALGKGTPLTVFGDDYDTPDGTCIRDYVHVQDLATAHLLALEAIEAGQSLGPLNLGTGQGYSVKQVIAATEAATGKTVPHQIGPRRAGDPARLVANPERAMSRLGWRPERSDLQTILEDAVRSRSSVTR
jgi:UDP-glucose-4-epimerase GalE